MLIIWPLEVLIMRRMILLVAASVIAGCQTPMPTANPEMAWVDLSIPFPNDRVLLAERLDKQRLEDGRFFQVTPGSHELMVKFDYETSGGGGMSMMGGPSVQRMLPDRQLRPFHGGATLCARSSFDCLEPGGTVV